MNTTELRPKNIVHPTGYIGQQLPLYTNWLQVYRIPVDGFVYEMIHLFTAQVDDDLVNFLMIEHFPDQVQSHFQNLVVERLSDEDLSILLERLQEFPTDMERAIFLMSEILEEDCVPVETGKEVNSGR